MGHGPADLVMTCSVELTGGQPSRSRIEAIIDTGATLSVIASSCVPQGFSPSKGKTYAIKVGDGRVVHSKGIVEVLLLLEGIPNIVHPCAVLDKGAFECILGMDLFRRNSYLKYVGV